MFNLPHDVETIITTIEDAGFSAWCVGGCVRDMLMGKTPSDYDIASSAPCEIIQSLFKKTVPTGIKHGTVTVIENGIPYEITRFRVDGEYNDNRHPNVVDFTTDFALDLSRRDFTINAIGYNSSYGVYDIFGGREDIKNGIVRTVGNPNERFLEDALRILRAVRFASVLEFSIDQATKSALISNACLLENIAAERISVELIKTLSGNKPSHIADIILVGGLKSFGIENYNCDKLDSIPNIPLLRLAVICVTGGADAEIVANSLKLSNSQKTGLLAYYKILELKNIELHNLKTYAEYVEYGSLEQAVIAYGIVNGCNTEKISKQIKKAAENNEPYCVAMLKISGDDLISIGYSGREIGKVQSALLEEVLLNPQHNNKEALIKLSESIKDKIKL